MSKEYIDRTMETTLKLAKLFFPFSRQDQLMFTGQVLNEYLDRFGAFTSLVESSLNLPYSEKKVVQEEGTVYKALKKYADNGKAQAANKLLELQIC